MSIVVITVSLESLDQVASWLKTSKPGNRKLVESLQREKAARALLSAQKEAREKGLPIPEWIDLPWSR